jgi:hypothetical protein
LFLRCPRRRSASRIPHNSATKTGTFPFIVTANSMQAPVSLFVDVPRPVIETQLLPMTTIGQNYSQAVAVIGGVPPYSFAATGLAAGLAINATGTISGAPTVSGNFNVTITVTDSAQTQSSAQRSLTVLALPTFVTPATLPAATAGVPCSQTVIATGGYGPYFFALPARHRLD